MGLQDLILFPLYVLFFHLFFASRRKKLADPQLRKYHAQGFWIKVLSTLAFTVFNVYISPGDSLGLFYAEGLNIGRMILKDFSNVRLLFIAGSEFDQSQLFNSLNEGYFNSQSNYFTTVLVAFFSLFSFSSYLIINLIFSMVSFSGVWKLYRFFYEQYPHLHKKLAIAILYLPTFVFWSSGILKDPICTGMMGWVTYSIYAVFIKRESILKNLLLGVLAAWILGTVKSYILVSYLPFLVMYLVFHNLRLVKSAGKRVALFGLVFIGGLVGFILAADKLQEELSQYSVEKITESVKVQQKNYQQMADLAESSFSLGVEFDGTPGSMLRMAPAAITATLFRPFLWESKKLSTLLSSLESLAMMLFTLYVLFKAGLFTFFKALLRDPMVQYCFLFAIVFALFVGATTLNFGTLVRYKIPCMPFYIIAFMLVLEQRKKAPVKSTEAPESNHP